MEIRRDIGFGLGSLITAGVAIALVAIGLFSRMTPALEHIREDNVVTLDAAREVLIIFTTRAGDALDIEERGRVEAALATMRQNLTVDNEGAMVAAVTDGVAKALTGDRAGLVELAKAVDTLARANTEAMAEADREAQRLGVAGAWTAAIGGIALVLIGLYARQRLERRLVRPLLEISRVLDASKAGDELARCRGMRGAVEIERALKQTNKLLDRMANAGDGVRPHDPRLNDQAVALGALLAERAGAWAVISATRGLVAANDAAHERLVEHDGGALLARLMTEVQTGKGSDLVVLEPGRLGLCRLDTPS